VFGLFTFLTTTFVISQAANILLVPLAIIRLLRGGLASNRMSGAQKIGWGLLIVAALVTTIVFTFGRPVIENYENSIAAGFPYILLIILSLIVGWGFKKSDLKIILVCVIVEIFVGIAEYIYGIPSFFGVQNMGDTMIGDTDLLYFNRVFGLSLNSSVYAFKVMLGLVILLYLDKELSRKVFLFASALIAAGFVTSFNRTAIIAAVVGVAIHYRKNWRVWLWGIPAALIALVAVAPYLMENFTRGRDEFDWSGRDVVFANFLSFLNDHFFFGNATRKVWLYLNGDLYHAHNSYLELVASNGMIISLIFLAGYYLVLLRGRLSLAAPILIYSLFQYGIFWGLVFHDIVFAALMFHALREHRQKAREIKKIISPQYLAQET